jgi:hypothetical protein
MRSPRTLAFLAALALSSAPLLSSGRTESPAGGPARAHEDREDHDVHDDVGKLVSELGSESWNRRESAREGILGAGKAAVPFLEEAALSPNLELAYRARSLLEEIDPTTVDFRVLKVRLPGASGPARIASSAAVSGRAGEKLAAVEPADARSTGSGPRTFSLTFHEGARGEIEIRAAEVDASRRSEVDLYPPLRLRSGVSIIKRSEECLYEAIGDTLKRRRDRFLTLLAVDSRRGAGASGEDLAAGGESPGSGPPDAVLQDLLVRLLEQARAPREPAAGSRAAEAAEAAGTGERTGEARVVALDVLAELRAPEAAPLFREALATPALRALASLGLDAPELLAEIAAGDRSPGERPGPEGAKGPRVTEHSLRAAARLVELGDERGLDLLLDVLSRSDPSQVHLVMATIADHILLGKVSERARDRILAVVLGKDFVSHALWQDQETEFLLAAAAGLLRPESEADRSLAAAFRGYIEEVAVEDPGLMPLSFDSCLDLWRRVGRRLPEDPSGEAGLAMRLLPGLSRIGVPPAARAWIDSTLSAAADGGEPGTSPAEILLPLRGYVRGSDEQLAADAQEIIVTLAPKLAERRGGLRPVVESLVEAFEAAPSPAPPPRPAVQAAAAGAVRVEATTTVPSRTSSLSLERRTEAELVRLTGLPRLPAPAGEHKVGSGRWREWLADSARVEAREAELQATGEKGADAGFQLVVYAFDLLAPAADSTGSVPPGSRLEVVGGRRLVIPDFRPRHYEGWWGRKEAIQLISRGGESTLRSYRLQMAGISLYANAGIPLLRPLPQQKLSSRVYETSDLFVGSRHLSSAASSAHRSLYLLHEPGPESPEPAAGASAEALWSWFLETVLFAVEPGAPARQIDAVFQAAGGLGMKEAVPALRRLFGAAPTPRRARVLHDLGDPSAAEHLRRALADTDPGARQEAARLLAELGMSEGAAALLEMAGAKPPASGSAPTEKPPTSGVAPSRAAPAKPAAAASAAAYQVFAALDRYLATAPADAPERTRALAFFLSQIDNRSLQHMVFRALERESGSDFGFTSARSLNDPAEQQAALARAAQEAKEWWAARSRSSAGR